MTFKAGDRVKFVANKQSSSDFKVLYGFIGTILKLSRYNDHSYAVQWDTAHKSLHDCDGMGKKHRCWFTDVKNLAPAFVTNWKEEMKGLL